MTKKTVLAGRRVLSCFFEVAPHKSPPLRASGREPLDFNVFNLPQHRICPTKQPLPRPTFHPQHRRPRKQELCGQVLGLNLQVLGLENQILDLAARFPAYKHGFGEAE